MKDRVDYGIDILLETPEKYTGLRIGLVCNQASLTNKGEHSRLALQAAGFHLTKLFAPEHGFDSTGEDGKFIHHDIDSLTQLPIISLYSEKLAPNEEDLSDLDLLIVDLPDVGARFYTYLWTMTYAMESCEEYGKPIVILDRPNPIANRLELVEGPMLDSECSSFIGRFPIPITHHCTFAELAQYFKAIYFPKLELAVVKMTNWDRITNTDYSVQPTSPAIQKRQTAYLYPGACLFEGLNINEGRGSDYPFEQFGAPWIDNEKLFSAVKSQLTEAIVEKVSYTPTFGLYENEYCYGLKITPKDLRSFKAVHYFITLIQLIHQLFPEHLTERNYLTNANPEGTKHLDKLLGLPHSFDKIIHNQIDTNSAATHWAKAIKPFLLYG